MLSFRRAVMGDAKSLYEWRNDKETQRNSHSSRSFDFESHCRWLQKSLGSEDREIFIAIVDGAEIGMVRRDRLPGAPESADWLLSWIISPAVRGRGYGSVMLVQFVTQYPARYTAEVKSDNTASIRIAEKAGLRPSFMVLKNYE